MKRIHFKTFTLSNVAVSTTGSEEELDIGLSAGNLDSIIVACSSTDFDISIRNKTGVSADSVNEIINYVTNDLRLEDSDIGRAFQNRDTVQTTKLYAVVNNDDSDNATGSIELELAIEEISKA